LTEYITEQEQIELLKSWIKQYSLVIIAGVALAFVAIFGWRTWQQRHFRILTHASVVYDEMLAARAQNDPEATLVQAKKLFSNYANTSYGPMAALMLGRDAAVKKQYPQSEKHFQWILDHSSLPSFRQIARLRLARVFIADKKPKEALAALETIDDKSFSGLIKEERGDAWLALNNNDKARESYLEALNDLPNADVMKPVLQMKYDNLATASPSLS